MTTLKLLKLELSYFQGIRSFTLEPNGNNVAIRAANGVGKTTLMNAFCWLLFGTNSLGESNFEIKELDAKNQPLHKHAHTVRGTFELPDGEKITFQRTYREQWVTKRGNQESEFEGHTTEYHVNNVPVQKREYDSQVASIYEPEMFKLLVDPRAFFRLNTDKRREKLFEVFGEISDEEVMASDPELSEITDFLGKYSMVQYERMARETIRNAKAEKDTIQPKIAEISRLIESRVFEEVPDIDAIEAALQEREAELVRLNHGGEIATKNARIKEIEAEISNRTLQLREEAYGGKEGLRNELEKAKNELSKLTSEAKELERFIADHSQRLQASEKKLGQLRAEYNEVDARTFEWEGSVTCDACGQSLPEEKVAEAREKALGLFNKNKSLKLEAIKREGVDLRSETEQYKEAIKGAEAKLLAHRETGIPPLLARCEELEAELASAPQPDFESDAKYQALVAEKAKVQAEVEKLKSDDSFERDLLTGRIETLKEERRKALRIITEIEQSEKHKKRITELEAREKELAAIIGKKEREIYLLEKFERAKCDLLTEQINRHFELIRWKLFERQVNGGFKPICEALLDGKPYQGALNTAGQINAGLDTINALAAKCGFAPTVWIDGCESVLEPISTRGQQIRLIVSEGDNEFRIVSDGILLPSTDQTPRQEALSL